MPCALGAPPTTAVSPAGIAAELAAVDSLLAHGDYAGAESRAAALYAVAAEDPIYGWQARQRLGVALLRSGQPEAALPLLEASAVEAIDDAVAHRNLATCLMALGRPGRALAEFREAADLAPQDAANRLDLGQALLQFGFYREAWPELSAAERLCGGCPQAARALASYYLETGEPGEAIRYLERVMAAQPDREIRATLAAAQVAAARPEDAVQLLAALPPGDLTAAEYRILLNADRALGSTERALGWARRAEVKADFPAEIATDAQFWAIVAEICQAGNQLAEALLAIDAAVAAAPQSALYRVNRAALLQQLGRQDEATRELERALAIDPGIVTDGR